jgi:hypothetical protein
VSGGGPKGAAQRLRATNQNVLAQIAVLCRHDGTGNGGSELRRDGGGQIDRERDDNESNQPEKSGTGMIL